MIAVADTSPVSALVRIGRVALLTDLFEQVIVPEEVTAELDAGQAILGDWRIAPGASGIVTRRVGGQLLLRQLASTLHLGEAAAIVLATEMPGAILVMDEEEGRRKARGLDLRVTGTLGLVVEAKRRHRVPSAAVVIDELRRRAGLWLSDEIVRHALELAGER